MPKGCGSNLSISDPVFLALNDEACRAKKIIEDKAKKELSVARKAKDIELKKWFEKELKNQKHIVISSNQFLKNVHIDKFSINSILSHIGSVEGKEIIKDIKTVLKDAKHQKGKDQLLDKKKPEKNLQRKIKRGVTGYRYYKSDWNGYEVTISMEDNIHGYEQPYSFKLTKKHRKGT